MEFMDQTVLLSPLTAAVPLLCVAPLLQQQHSGLSQCYVAA